ncbi:unnamed protein product [Symbiodinium necroappetens]|uniref:Uncharacterized protein n=1 Tax=Symbiodinium necroappetens TaxID=1628268 RepID=A0A812J664_9DINO|nr:unnamed protein product [Symbiodinium necroappetens]
MTPPKRWNFLKPDHFGPQWDEKERPASCTSDLTSYSGMVIPALLWYAHYELRTSKTQQLQVPDLKFDSLMPLWGVLQKAMAAGRTSMSLAFAMHALMISTVKVNGEQRCARIAVTCRANFSKFVSQLERDHEFYDHPSAAHNLTIGKLWVDEAEKRMRATPPGGEQDDLLKQIGCLQRDYALLLNPWVAGQQQLVALVAVAIGIGSSVVDSRGQIRFVLHLYNALRCAEVVQSLPMLDWLLEIFRSSKAIWHAGRPTEDFLQHWYLSLGMAVSSETYIPARCTFTWL